MKKQSGFTLVEILLVLVIVSMIIVMGIGYMQQQTQALRVDKTSLQMQQVLNGGLAYYVTHSSWPANPGITTMQGSNFLPPGNFTNPWGQNFGTVIEPNQQALFYVYTSVTGSSSGSALASASMIAGKLPMSAITDVAPTQANISSPKTCKATDTTCYITASVNVPGQNLNNASAVNFAGVYHHGGCIPTPTCPALDANGNPMTAQIFIVPISVSGLYDSSGNAYPISSFTAYPSQNIPSTNPVGCQNSTNTQACANNPASATDKFWRACLQISTNQGDVTPANQAANNWGQNVTLGAFTRCSSSTEKSGGGLNIFSN